MTEITLFRFEDFDVLAAMLDGEPQFAASQVAAALGYADTDQAVRKHCKAAKTYPVEMTGQVRNVKMIPERDVYRLILRSKKPSAEAFEEKVVGEILPSIRKTGSYNTAPAIDLNDPAFLRQTLLGYTEKVIALEAENAALTPKAESFDALANLEGRHNLRSAAAQCGWPQNKFIDRLISLGWVYVNTATGRKHAYSDRIKTGMMEVKNVEVKRTGYTEGVGQPMITQKGLARLKMLLGVYQVAPSREMELH